VNTKKHQFLSRLYVQPQWVYDCINNQFLIPEEEYTIGATLPPHLSPFVDNQSEGYIPERQKKLDRIKDAMENGIPYDPEEEEEAEPVYELSDEEEEEVKEEDKEDISALYDKIKEDQEAKAKEAKAKEEEARENENKKKVDQKQKNASAKRKKSDLAESLFEKELKAEISGTQYDEEKSKKIREYNVSKKMKLAEIEAEKEAEIDRHHQKIS